MGKAREGRGGGKAFETRQKIVGFIFVRKASKIDLSRLILLLPEAFLKERGRGAGRVVKGDGREGPGWEQDWPAVREEGAPARPTAPLMCLVS